MPTESGNLERDIVMSYVAVEATWGWGYGVARRALHGPKWVMPAATSLNSSSLVCCIAHSSSVTYLHVDCYVPCLLTTIRFEVNGHVEPLTDPHGAITYLCLRLAD